MTHIPIARRRLLLGTALAGLAHLWQQQVARITIKEIAVGGTGQRLHQRPGGRVHRRRSLATGRR